MKRKYRRKTTPMADNKEVINIIDSPDVLVNNRNMTDEKEVINIMDSPDVLVNNRKRKKESDEEEAVVSTPKHPLLESVKNRFQQNRQINLDRQAVESCKREAEQVHADYIIKNVASPLDIARAGPVVKHWATVNGLKDRHRKRPAAARTPAPPPKENYPITSSLNNPSMDQSAQPSFSTANHLERDKQPAARPNHITANNQKSPKKSKNEKNKKRSLETMTLTEVIDLDTTNEESILECSFDDSVKDISNNSNTPERKTKATQNSSSPSSTMQKHVCSVLNCDATFTSEAILMQHMNLFQHSPCNPCLLAKNCKLAPDPLCFMCPACDREFETTDECRSHMSAENHLSFYPPLAIAGYMCPQCLHVFENFAACWEHIEGMSHNDICYPFKDDYSGNTSGPVAVVEELVQDLIAKCIEVPFQVQCLECGLGIEYAAEVRQHVRETNGQHLMSALTNTNLVDIFAEYLAGFTCNTCRRLFTGELKELAKHQCARGITGTIVENDITSFANFVKRCALTLVKSTDPEPCAGPSRQYPGTSNAQFHPNSAYEQLKKKLAKQGNTRIPPETKQMQDQERDNREKVRSLDMCSSQQQNQKFTQRKTVEIPFDELPLPVNGGAKRKKKKINHETETTSTYQTDPSIENLFTNTTAIEMDEESANTETVSQSLKSHAPNTTYVCHQATTKNKLIGLFNSSPFDDPDTQYLMKLNESASEQLKKSKQMPDLKQNVSAKPQLSNNQVPETSQISKTKCQEQGTSHDRNRATSACATSTQPSTEGLARRDRSRSPLDQQLSIPQQAHVSPTSTENLMRMRNIIFLDLDNWPGFFSKLPRVLPDLTFVWGFYGGAMQWKEPHRCYIFNQMKQRKQFYLNDKCGRSKDAADFAIVLTVGKMDERLSQNIAFTILSGDKGFCEVERQMKSSARKAVVIDPHSSQRFSNDMIYAMVTSVTDT